ncbi:hypothetical protein OPQ81_008192 [Rhizoctonia solani]|nr:hypothetical protein OPQ81_008192 [Rhizoctonia solani]
MLVTSPSSHQHADNAGTNEGIVQFAFFRSTQVGKGGPKLAIALLARPESCMFLKSYSDAQDTDANSTVSRTD